MATSHSPAARTCEAGLGSMCRWCTDNSQSQSVCSKNGMNAVPPLPA
jgi:hypothetical protein